MTEKEVKSRIQEIPVGSKLQIIKKNGSIMEVHLASHEVSGTEKKDYGTLVVPALPPAIIVQGGPRFGKFRLELDKIVDIARVE